MELDRLAEIRGKLNLIAFGDAQSYGNALGAGPIVVSTIATLILAVAVAVSVPA